MFITGFGKIKHFSWPQLLQPTTHQLLLANLSLCCQLVTNTRCCSASLLNRKILLCVCVRARVLFMQVITHNLISLLMWEAFIKSYSWSLFCHNLMNETTIDTENGKLFRCKCSRIFDWIPIIMNQRIRQTLCLKKLMLSFIWYSEEKYQMLPVWRVSVCGPMSHRFSWRGCCKL